jgi:hypothetical protein
MPVKKLRTRAERRTRSPSPKRESVIEVAITVVTKLTSAERRAVKQAKTRKALKQDKSISQDQYFECDEEQRIVDKKDQEFREYQEQEWIEWHYGQLERYYSD